MARTRKSSIDSFWKNAAILLMSVMLSFSIGTYVNEKSVQPELESARAYAQDRKSIAESLQRLTTLSENLMQRVGTVEQKQAAQDAKGCK